MVIFPKSGLKNRPELEYSPIGAKFPLKIAYRTLNNDKQNFSKNLYIVHVTLYSCLNTLMSI
jgi:hypothetical protein